MGWASEDEAWAGPDAITTFNGRSIYWILDEQNTPVPATLRQYSAFMAEGFKTGSIATRTYLVLPHHEGYVSTVFLGIDHSHSHTYGPVLWETMYFTTKGEDIGEWSRRYISYEEAMIGH